MLFGVPAISEDTRVSETEGLLAKCDADDTSMYGESEDEHQGVTEIPTLILSHNTLSHRSSGDASEIDLEMAHGSEQTSKASRLEQEIANQLGQEFKSAKDCLGTLDGLDKRVSLRYHKMSAGKLDYLYAVGAFAWGNRGMPCSLVLSILVQGVGGFFFSSISALVTVLSTQTLKHIIKRPRPDPATCGDKKCSFWWSARTNYSMPSGDTAQAAVFGFSLYFMNNGWLWLLCGPFGAWGRVYYGVHYIGDTLAGFVIGAGLTTLMWIVIPASVCELTGEDVWQYLHGDN